MTNIRTQTYTIDDMHGNHITTGLQEHVAARVAQRLANERRQSVYLWVPDATEAQEFTPDEITDDQIRALRAEAAEAGDDAQINMCDLALSSRGTWRAIDEVGHPDDGTILTRDTARSECECVIRAKRAE